MPPKAPEQPSGKTATQPAAAAKSGTARKPWVKKTPVQIVLDQGEKLKVEIQELEEELKAKKRQLAKFEEVRRILDEGS